MRTQISSRGLRSLFAAALVVAAGAQAGVPTAPGRGQMTAPVGNGKIKYKAAREMRFDKTDIQGALERPETLMVSGDVDSDEGGLLSLRDHFHDRILSSAGRTIQKKHLSVKLESSRQKDLDVEASAAAVKGAN